MRRLLTIALVSTLPLVAVPKKKPVHKSTASSKRTASSRPSAFARPSASSKHTVSKASASKKRRALAAAPSGPRMQSAPSSERYREIQEALIGKGYLKTPATGAWDPDSQEAMRKFQADQNLDVTGKLSARTLISLGLGPKP